MYVPALEVVLLKAKDEFDIFAMKSQPIVKIGLGGIGITYSTVLGQEQALTVQIKDFVFFNETALL